MALCISCFVSQGKFLEMQLPEHRAKLSLCSLGYCNWTQLYSTFRFTVLAAGRDPQGKGSLCGHFSKDANPINEVSILMIWSCPKDPTSKCQHLRVRISAYELREDGHSVHCTSVLLSVTSKFPFVWGWTVLLSHQQHTGVRVSPEDFQFDNKVDFNRERLEPFTFKTGASLMEIHRGWSAENEGLGLRKGHCVF